MGGCFPRLFGRQILPKSAGVVVQLTNSHMKGCKPITHNHFLCAGERPVRLAGVKGLLRVGGGGLFKGGGEGCLRGEGGFFGWPKSPSPPLQKNKGGRGVC